MKSIDSVLLGTGLRAFLPCSVRFSDYFESVIEVLTVSEAKPRLGALLDRVSKGAEVLLRRKKHLYRVEEISELAPISCRPVGFFRFADADELTALADHAEPSFDAS